MMKRYRVRDDSHIDRIGHDPSGGIVEIRFSDSNPEVYELKGVSDEEFEEFYHSRNKVDFYREHFKGKGHTVSDVDPDNEDDYPDVI